MKKFFEVIAFIIGIFICIIPIAFALTGGL